MIVLLLKFLWLGCRNLWKLNWHIWMGIELCFHLSKLSACHRFLPVIQTSSCSIFTFWANRNMNTNTNTNLASISSKSFNLPSFSIFTIWTNRNWSTNMNINTNTTFASVFLSHSNIHLFHTFLPFNTWFNIPGEYCDINLFITVKYSKINLRNEITKIFFSGPVPGKAVGGEGGKVDSHAWGKTGRLKPLLLNLLLFVCHLFTICLLFVIHLVLL